MRSLAIRIPLLSLLAAALGSGCGPSGPQRDPHLPVGQPIQLQANTWSWIDFPDSTCDEGTPTGLVANLNGSKNLMIFFNGGGACWDGMTCLGLHTSTSGPITRATFDAGGFDFKNSILDRQLAKNPYKDWNLVFVPYCTGDLHFGDNDATYTYNSTTQTVHHKGRKNVEAYLARLAATISEPDQVLVTGSSAGGFGATLNYDLIRRYFPGAKVTLLNDSGPMLKGSAFAPSLRTAWTQAWNYGAALDAIDPTIQSDFSAIYTALGTKYPKDRMALLSYSQDEVISRYVGITATQFETDLNDLETSVLTPLANARFYVVTGNSHTFLGNPAGATTASVGLLDWLTQMQTGTDTAWASVHP